MIPILYTDRSITVTPDFIRVDRFRDEVIPINQVSGVRTVRTKIGDFNTVAAFFMVLGVISLFIFPIIAFYFFGMQLVAGLKKRYRYTLIVTVKGYEVRILDSAKPARRAQAAIKAAVRKINLNIFVPT